MFTGIIEEKGQILTLDDKKIVIKCSKVLENSKIGDSICVSGVCLTATKLESNSFTADTSAETLRVTTLGKLKSGSIVNLERAMSANGRFGGHIVSGHTDSIAQISSIKKHDEFCNLEIELTKEQVKYVVKKGSIAINGISLTIADIQGQKITIAIIPHTFENTNLKDLKIGDCVNIETDTNLIDLKVGDYVNIEVDILAKYVENFLSTRDNSSGISIDFLQRNGFC